MAPNAYHDPAVVHNKGSARLVPSAVRVVHVQAEVEERKMEVMEVEKESNMDDNDEIDELEDDRWVPLLNDGSRSYTHTVSLQYPIRRCSLNSLHEPESTTTTSRHSHRSSSRRLPRRPLRSSPLPPLPLPNSRSSRSQPSSPPGSQPLTCRPVPSDPQRNASPFPLRSPPSRLRRRRGRSRSD